MGGQPIAAESFRRVLGSVPAPVSVVTGMADGRPHGTTVSAFCSLSLEPPLVLVSLDRDSDLLALLRNTRRYGVNVLAAGQAELARRFARKGHDKFVGAEWEEDDALPRLPGAQAWLACDVVELVPAGDHEIAIGRVLAAACTDSKPLVYRERAFWGLRES